MKIISISALVLGLSLPASAGLLGNYGVLTDFSCKSETAARAAVLTMSDSFGIREFQFYDWFADYSTPTSGAVWADPFRRRSEICLSTIIACIDEIHRHGGRAWAYVQAVGAEEDDLADTGSGIYPLIDANGAWHRHEGRFPAYFLNAAWALRMAEVWAAESARLGFDGIHWDSLGPVAGDYGAEVAGTREFLRATRKALAVHGLKQTFNFVDLSWWDGTLAVDRVVEFPYAEIWNADRESAFLGVMADTEMANVWGVIAFYPNLARGGQSESQVMLDRWTQYRRHRLSYLLIADGARRVTGPYYPDNVALTPSEIGILAAPPGR